MPTPCSHDDCREPARWQAVLETRERPRAVGRRVRLLQLGYCDQHKRTVRLDDVLSSEAHEKLGKTLLEDGKEKIDPRLTTLGWAPLGPADRRRLARGQHRTTSRSSDEEDDLSF